MFYFYCLEKNEKKNARERLKHVRAHRAKQYVIFGIEKLFSLMEFTYI